MKGILFKPWKVKLIGEMKDGDTMVTRRVIKPQPSCKCEPPPDWHGQIIDWIGYKHEGKLGYFCYKCGSGLHAIDTWSSHGTLPRYQVGEVVYTKEAWTLSPFNNDDYQVIYRLSPLGGAVLKGYQTAVNQPFNIDIWHSPIFLKEIHARHFIEIVGIRPERLQEISGEDIEAEGYDWESMLKPYPSPLDWFIPLWDSINPDDPWSSNPWVWRCEFKRIVKA